MIRDIEIINIQHPLKVPLRAGLCTSFWCRLKGLSFRRSIPLGWGLLMGFRADSRMDTSIHMLGMNFDLGIVWINADGKVVDLKHARKWLSFLFPKEPAKYVLEVLPQRLDEFHIGDQIRFEDIE